ncbi:ninjurin-1-like [Teleopsis dalmanni]|uniref:ninjurin-1-like n=1 Tax=Teleopsis dalmanni TaxID=139649 RepID=UPI0018CFC0E3|nr:ninjurin-1-like [Teleopsis dalmanni]
MSNHLNTSQMDQSATLNVNMQGGRRSPRAVPEIDDEHDNRPTVNGGEGVDDGFLLKDQTGGARPHADLPEMPGFSFNYDRPGFVDINGVPTPIPDVNAYQHKKTLAQGMMDLALLSANANQLRYILETNSRHPYYYSSIIFITLSIIFQIGVGVGLIWNTRYNVKNEKEICKANKINNYTVIGIFIVTIVNVFVSAFSVADRPGTS